MGATGEELKEGKGFQKLANLKRSCLDPALSPCLTRRRGGGGSLRAFRRAWDLRSRALGEGTCVEPWPLGGLLDAKASRGSLGGVLGLLFGVLGVSWSRPGEVPRGLGEALEASWWSFPALKHDWSSKGVLPGAYGGLWGGFGSRWVLKWLPF